jgi:hypothetical protein
MVAPLLFVMHYHGKKGKKKEAIITDVASGQWKHRQHLPPRFVAE